MYRMTEYTSDGYMITSTDVSDIQIAYAVQRDMQRQGKIVLITFANR